MHFLRSTCATLSFTVIAFLGQISGVWGLDDDGGLPDLEYPPTPTSRSFRGVTRFYKYDRPIATVHADGFCMLASGHADGRA